MALEPLIETMATTSQLLATIEEILTPSVIRDDDRARNGLQIENSGSATKIGAAVDSALPTFELAVERGVNFLLVHHGLFWEGAKLYTGAHYRKLALAIENDIALVSMHLPLDVHPEFGNAAQLAQAMDLRDGYRWEPFLPFDGQTIGLRTDLEIDREELHQRLERAVEGTAHLAPGGPTTIRRLGIATGAVGAEIEKAAAEGIDTLITGEGPHWSYPLAEELGLNLFYAGHYATETFGVKALAAHLSDKHALPWEFLDHPTGL